MRRKKCPVPVEPNFGIAEGIKGVHVVLEKPMTVILEETVAIRRVEKESGKILPIGFQPRLDEKGG